MDWDKFDALMDELVEDDAFAGASSHFAPLAFQIARISNVEQRSAGMVYLASILEAAPRSARGLEFAQRAVESFLTARGLERLVVQAQG